MAAEPTTGMAKGDMKRLLGRSKAEPVNAAIGQAADGTGLILLDKTKQGRALEAEMKKLFPDNKLTRFGTAFVDVDADPKLAKFKITRAANGLARRLAKTLRGTGFNKVEIVLEDDTLIDSYDEEATDAAPPAATPPAAAPPAPPAQDAASLTRSLTGLVQGIAKADPARRGELVGLAGQAQAALKGGDLAAAERVLAQLEAAMGAAPAPAAEAASGAGGGAYAKPRQAWLAARKKVEVDLDKLRGEIVAAFPDHADEIAKRYTDVVAPVLRTLDGTLADALDAAGSTKDPQERATLLQQVQTTIRDCEAYVAESPLVTDLDGNPFTPLAIRQVMGATLSVLSKTVR